MGVEPRRIAPSAGCKGADRCDGERCVEGGELGIGLSVGGIFQRPLVAGTGDPEELRCTIWNADIGDGTCGAIGGQASEDVEIIAIGVDIEADPIVRILLDQEPLALEALAGFGEEAGFELEVFIINGLKGPGCAVVVERIGVDPSRHGDDQEVLIALGVEAQRSDIAGERPDAIEGGIVEIIGQEGDGGGTCVDDAILCGEVEDLEIADLSVEGIGEGVSAAIAAPSEAAELEELDIGFPGHEEGGCGADLDAVDIGGHAVCAEGGDDVVCGAGLNVGEREDFAAGAVLETEDKGVAIEVGGEVVAAAGEA